MKRRLLGLGLLLAPTLLPAGCAPEEPEPIIWTWHDLSVAWDDISVLDPRLPGAEEAELGFTVESATAVESDCALELVARTAGGQERVLATGEDFDGSWSGRFDGRDELGRVMDAGPVQLAASLVCDDEHEAGAGEGRGWVLRLGLSAIDFPDEDEGRVPLAYHKLDLFTRGLTELTGVTEWRADRAGDTELAALDRDDGSPRPAPAPWLDPDVPPWGPEGPGGAGVGYHNVPAGYAAGAAPTIEVRAGETTLSQAGGGVHDPRGPAAFRDQQPPIRLVLEQGEPLGDDSWVPGQPRFYALPPLPMTLGRSELALRFHFEQQVTGPDGDEWVALPGSIETVHPLWLTAGATAVPDGDWLDASPPVSWIGVLSDIEAAVGGLPADDTSAIMDALRDALNADPYFFYNPNDAAYTDFTGEYIFWDYTWVNMSAFLDRAKGLALYCHSVACVLSSQANHLGIEAEYLTLGLNFQTHMTRAAGSDEWRTWGFNSHGVATWDGRVWDAAVDIDGDDEPSRSPVTPIAPRGLPIDDYFRLLSDDPLEQVNGGRCYVF